MSNDSPTFQVSIEAYYRYSVRYMKLYGVEINLCDFLNKRFRILALYKALSSEEGEYSALVSSI